MHVQLFHMTEDKLKEVEHEYDDNTEFTKEASGLGSCWGQVIVCVCASVG